MYNKYYAFYKSLIINENNFNMNKDLSIKKDRILALIYNSSDNFGVGHKEIASELNVSEQLALDILDTIADEGYISHSTSANITGEKYVMEKEGRIFIEHGSFLSKWKKDNDLEKRNLLKDYSGIAGTVIALISIYIAWMTMESNDKIIAEIDHMKRTVSRSNSRIDSLVIITKPTMTKKKTPIADKIVKASGTIQPIIK